MEKDSSIVELVTWLTEQLGEQFVLADYWGADLCATGFSSTEKPEILAYVSSWRLPKGHYYLDIEAVRPTEIYSPGQTIERHDSLTRDELLTVISRHLAIPP